MAFKAYLTGSSQYNKRPNDRVCLVDGGCVCCFETSSIFLSVFVKNLPGVISLLFVTRSRMLVCNLASSMPQERLFSSSVRLDPILLVENRRSKTRSTKQKELRERKAFSVLSEQSFCTECR